MANSFTSPWSDERTARAKSLWIDGWSAGQIAIDLGGVTRNAVIGRLNRLGLRDTDRSLKVRDARAEPKRFKTPVAKKAPRIWFGSPPKGVTKPEPFIPAPAPLPPSCEPVGLFALTSTTCRFPVTDAQPWMFCGDASANQADGRSYCPYHHALTHDQPKKLNPKRPALRRAA
jgi:GcrA cell cycle regulator